MCGQHCDFCFALKWLLQNKLRISNIFGEFFNFPIASLDDFLFFYFRKNCIIHRFLNTENDNSFSNNTHMKYKQIYLSGSNEFISDCWCPEGFLWVYSKVSIQLFLGNSIFEELQCFCLLNSSNTDRQILHFVWCNTLYWLKVNTEAINTRAIN